MDFQVKLFNWQDQGNHLIILARGVMENPAFRDLFDKIQTATQDLRECKILVDLSDSTYQITGAEIAALVASLPLDRWPPGNKVAFVSASEISDYHRLLYLRTELVARGLLIEVFRNAKVAIDWLAGML
ncbi:MAG TPA: hypothetical protein VH985_17810 [Candidatus Binatia bacterium]|jgi:hypothetical protein